MTHLNIQAIGQGIVLNPFFCTPRLRADHWNLLKDAILRLHGRFSAGKETNRVELEVRERLEALQRVESYWGFPGKLVLDKLLIAHEARHWDFLVSLVTVVARLISTDHYRSHDWMTSWRELFLPDESQPDINNLDHQLLHKESRPYFEVLVVDSLAIETDHQLRNHHLESRRPEDPFVYNIVVVKTFEDAIIALLLNYNIQSCVVRYTFPMASANTLDILDDYIRFAGFSRDDLLQMSNIERSGALGRILRTIRPELDLYLLSEATVEDVSSYLHRDFRRCFFGSEDYPEMRLTILKGIMQRYETPFFNALKVYTQQPTGVFHAMPISRSKSISKSHWIRDYGEFYGDRIFLSETSATTGGLDSLLQPSGSIRRAQELAANAFGSERCFFVTNGTSTANKIVLQGITKPGDIVLIANDSHKSHYHAAILADICPVVVEAYTLDKYSMLGAVPLRRIKRALLLLKQEGQLDRVRSVILTNLTFDGVAYDPIRIITECLAIKPDLIFFFDEAWFAYGMFTPITRRRSAMFAASHLRRHFASESYRQEYRQWRLSYENQDFDSIEDYLDTTLLPDPDKVRIRVYATQSTHKTLTALRQASMIHIHDEDFNFDVSVPFRDAYLCHTSTSPNYQILASLDIARRQMHFEGYELIQKAYELAQIFRNQVKECRLLSRFFHVLTANDMIPDEYRLFKEESSSNLAFSWQVLEDFWSQNEFALDPSRITLDITQTGMDGREFQQLLVDRFDIQVNKISFNTVLFIIHIGSTRGMIAYLLESLSIIARDLDKDNRQLSPAHIAVRTNRIEQHLNEAVQLPSFTFIHPRFTGEDDVSSGRGMIRKAYYLSRIPGATHYLYPSDELSRLIDAGEQFASAAMVTPYPPGYPILIPGQILSAEIVRFLIAVNQLEIHGYDPDLGLLVFCRSFLDSKL